MLIKNKNQKQKRIIISLLMPILIGIFLWPQTAWLSAITPENIINFTNQERQKQDLPALTANQLLTKAAYEKGQAILASQNFQHNINGRKFSSWIKDAGYNYAYAGENLAIDFITNEGVIKAWLNSPSHRRNLLNKNFQEIGVAVLNGWFEEKNTTLVVQIFGQPLTAKTAIIKPLSQFTGRKEFIKTANPALKSVSVQTPVLKNYSYLLATNPFLYSFYFFKKEILNCFPLSDIFKNSFAPFLPTTFSSLAILFYFIFTLILAANLKITLPKLNPRS